jgi:hypothetical protein
MAPFPYIGLELTIHVIKSQIHSLFEIYLTKTTLKGNEGGICDTLQTS